MKRVVIVGGGFGGLNAAKILGGAKEIDITLIDKKNYHLFQPLLYQVAMAGLSSTNIAVPIRSILADYPNVRVFKEDVTSADLARRKVCARAGEVGYDYLILACGAQHSYFGHEAWEKFAPGLKTIEQATEIRTRVLEAFEKSEMMMSREEQAPHLTFVVVGGGPTGVELAGAIADISRVTVAREFRNINPKSVRVILVEAAPRILLPFSEEMARRAVRDLEELGVEVNVSTPVTKIESGAIEAGGKRIEAATILWAAGVQASSLGKTLGIKLDRQGRIVTEADLSLPNYPEVFAIGDQAHVKDSKGNPLPAVATVALQEGKFVAHNILREIKNRPRKAFRYFDKGKMVTIGKSKAIAEIGPFKLTGTFAWLVWLTVHILYLTGFRNRLLVLIQWAWAYLIRQSGARLIISREWRSYPS